VALDVVEPDVVICSQEIGSTGGSASISGSGCFYQLLALGPRYDLDGRRICSTQRVRSDRPRDRSGHAQELVKQTEPLMGRRTHRCCDFLEQINDVWFDYVKATSREYFGIYDSPGTTPCARQGVSAIVRHHVTPAKAGSRASAKNAALISRFRGNDR